MVTSWTIEDYLSSFESTSGRPVFCWMNDEMSSRHSDSYGTCLNFPEAMEAFEKSPFSKEDWNKAINEWTNNTNVGIPLRILVIFLKDKIVDPCGSDTP